MIYASQSSVFKPLGGHKEASLLLKQTSHMRSSRPGYRHWIPIRRTLTIFPVILCLSCSRCHDGNSDGRIRTARCRSPLSFPPSDGSSFHSAGGTFRTFPCARPNIGFHFQMWDSAGSQTGLTFPRLKPASVKSVNSPQVENEVSYKQMGGTSTSVKFRRFVSIWPSKSSECRCDPIRARLWLKMTPLGHGQLPPDSGAGA